MNKLIYCRRADLASHAREHYENEDCKDVFPYTPGRDLVPEEGEEILIIAIKRGDRCQVWRDGVLNVQGRSMNDLVLAFCRFIDLSPLEIAENCKVIEDQYQTLRATTEAKSS